MSNKKVKATVEAQLKDKVSRRANKMTRAVNKFKRSAKLKGVNERWSRFNTTVGKTTRKLSGFAGKLGLLGVGAGVAAGVKHVVSLSAKLNQLGIDAGKNGVELASWKTEFQRQLEETAIAMNVSSDGIADGVIKIVKDTGALEFATANMENLAIMMSATSEQGATFGATFSQLFNAGIKLPKDVLSAMDLFTGQGQSGSFTAGDFSRNSPKIFGVYAPKDQKDFQAMGAVIQSIQDGTGVAEQTVTDFKALLDAVRTAANIKKLEAAGIKLLDMAASQIAGEPVLLGIEQVVKNIVTGTNGNHVILSNLLSEKKAREALSSTMNEFAAGRGFERLDARLAVRADGSGVRLDAADNRRETKARVSGFNEEVKQFAGDALGFVASRRNRGFENYSQDRRLLLDSPAEKASEVAELISLIKRGSVDVGGKVVIEINQTGRASIKSINSNDTRVNYITKQNLGPRMAVD